MASKKQPPTTDALEMLYRQYIHGRPRAQARLEAARLSSTIAQEIYDLRTGAKLTQKQLADLVGTSHSVISRLEDADYNGHSLKLLQRICKALDHRLQIRFIPIPTRRRKSA